MRLFATVLILLGSTVVLPAQDAASQDVRPKDVKDIAKAGTSALPRLQQLLKNPSTDVRVEAVRQITEIGTQRSLDPLIQALQDMDAEVQIRPPTAW